MTTLKDLLLCFNKHHINHDTVGLALGSLETTSNILFEKLVIRFDDQLAFLQIKDNIKVLTEFMSGSVEVKYDFKYCAMQFTGLTNMIRLADNQDVGLYCDGKNYNLTELILFVLCSKCRDLREGKMK